MSVLVNPQTNEVHEFGPQESQKLIQQGWLVPLINKEGQPEAIPFEEGNSYLKNGYALPNDSELDHLLKKTQFSTSGQKALAFTEGAIRGVAGPSYDLLAPKTGLTTTENIKSRKELQPEYAGAGEIGSTIAGAATGFGLPGLIGKAGTAANLATKALPKIVGLAAQGAAEAGLYKVAEKIDERLLGDPEALGEGLLGHIGLSSFLGGSAAFVLGPIGSAVNKAGKLTEKAAEKLSGEHVVGKALDKIIDGAADLSLPGIMRPAAKLAKKAVINSVLAIAPEKQVVLNQLSQLGELAQKSSNLIERKASGIFGSQIEKTFKKSEPDSSAQEPQDFHNLGTMVLDHAADPEKLIDKMSHSTMLMASSAPDISNALTANVARAVTFLASKVPAPAKEGLLDSDPKPSRSEIAQFNRYAQVIENPTSVLDHVKMATVLPQDLEALGAVYPQLYENMKTSVMGQLISKMGKQKSLLLPYNKRMSLSLFLGTPLDSTMKPQSIMSNQQSFGTMHIQRQQQSAMQGMARASKAGMGRMDPFKDLTRSQRALTRR